MQLSFIYMKESINKCIILNIKVAGSVCVCVYVQKTGLVNLFLLLYYFINMSLFTILDRIGITYISSIEIFLIN